MMFKKVSVPPATSKGAGGHGQKTPLQEPHGGGFRPGRRALAPTDDAGTPTIQRPCHRLDWPPSARSVFGCSRVSPAKALPVEALAPGLSLIHICCCGWANSGYAPASSVFEVERMKIP